jgi:hypothetical protein
VKPQQYREHLTTLKIIADNDPDNVRKFVRLYNHRVHMAEVAFNQRQCRRTLAAQHRRMYGYDSLLSSAQ